MGRTLKEWKEDQLLDLRIPVTLTPHGGIQAFVEGYQRFEFRVARIAVATSLPSASQPALLK